MTVVGTPGMVRGGGWGALAVAGGGGGGKFSEIEIFIYKMHRTIQMLLNISSRKVIFKNYTR